MKTIMCKKLTMVLIGLIVIFVQDSCTKFVEVDAPINAIAGPYIFTTDATAAAVLTGIYTGMSSSNSFATGINSVSSLGALSSDEVTLFSGVTNELLIAVYRNSLSSQINPSFWSSLYSYIYKVNSAIEGLNSSATISVDIKKQLLGEAKFLRAFFYFYLINLYGDVPLITSSDFRINSTLPRVSKDQVYLNIISDLKDAQEILSSNYVDALALNMTQERVRPNKWVATALLARVYLYLNDWNNAELQSTSVIDSAKLYDTVSLSSSTSNVFEKNSKEAIWQLQPVNSGWNTEEARFFILPTTGPSATTYNVYLSNSFLSSFEINDLRKVNWIGNVNPSGKIYYYPKKYKSASSGAAVTEYLMVFRLAEQYLIRAEARAKKGNVQQALSDLNVIRKRARLPSLATTDQKDVISAIMHERQVELFTEWGHRWFDLKRSQEIGSVMNIVSVQKGGSWETTDQLFPIPFNDIDKNKSLEQTPGY